MTPAEFLQIARVEGIRSDAFDIDDIGDRNECYVCTPAANGWRVFYAERGLERQAQQFATRSEALRHLLTLLRADPTAKRRAP